MDDPLLSEIFRFRHKQPSVDQSSSTCSNLVDLFAQFMESVKVVAIPEGDGDDPFLCHEAPPVAKETPWTSLPAPRFSVGEHAELKRVCEITRTKRLQLLAIRGSRMAARYGCEIQVSVTNVADEHLNVVFPDGWELVLHTLPSGEDVPSAVSTAQGEILCGSIDPALFKEFFTVFSREMIEAKQRKGGDRNAASGSGIGHQKTPSFVPALVKNAVASVCASAGLDGGFCGTGSRRVTGGTTNVGLHTGISPHDTCWPVVCAVFQHNLNDGGGLWQKALAAFQLYLLDKAVADTRTYTENQEPLEQATADTLSADLHSSVVELCNKVDELFGMLQPVARLTVLLLEADHDVVKLQSACKRARDQLESLLTAASRWLGTTYALPDSTELEAWARSETPIQLVPPPRTYNQQAAGSFSDIHRVAMANLGYSSFNDRSQMQLL